MGRVSEQAEIDRQIRVLAGHLRYPLSLPPQAPSGTIDLDMAEFANQRHRVGPLLYRAVDQTPNTDINVETEPDAREYLHEAYQHTIYLDLKQKTVAKALHALLSEHSIPCFIIKGGPLAAQLYDEPHIRWAKDIDAVVPLVHIASALAVLTQAGYRFVDGPQTLRPRRDRWRLWANKDMSFIDPKFGQIIELHERLIHLEPKGFTQSVTDFDGASDAPSISHSAYGLYLILHGALTYFRRLKWLADLSLLLRRVTALQKAEIFALSKRYHCLQAVIASLQFTEDYFPDSLDADWKTLIAANEVTEQTFALRERFAHSLCGSQDGNLLIAPPMPYFPVPERVIFERPTLGSSEIWFRKAVGVLTRR